MSSEQGRAGATWSPRPLAAGWLGGDLGCRCLRSVPFGQPPSSCPNCRTPAFPLVSGAASPGALVTYPHQQDARELVSPIPLVYSAVLLGLKDKACFLISSPVRTDTREGKRCGWECRRAQLQSRLPALPRTTPQVRPCRPLSWSTSWSNK